MSIILMQALRSILCDTALHGRWSSAAYIDDQIVHLNDDDKKMMARKDKLNNHNFDCSIGNREENSSEDDVVEDWIQKRLVELS